MNDFFPYEAMRPGQAELINAVAEAVKIGRSLAINAPSGFGKTIAVLAGALSNCKRIVWFTRTHRQAERVIEEVKAISLRRPVTALAIQSRASLCPYSCELSPDEAAVLCQVRRSMCELYRGFLTSFNPPSPLILKPSEVYAYCLERKLCPYYVQLSLVSCVNVLAASFFFLTVPLVQRILQIDKSVLVVLDEAHGIPSTLCANQSLELTSRSLDQAAREAEVLSLKSLSGFIDTLKDFLEKAEEDVWRPRQLAKALQAKTEYPLQVLAGALIHWGNEVRREMAKRGERPRSYLYNLGQFLSKLLTCSEEFVASIQPRLIQLVCLDAKAPELGAKCYIYISGTLDKALLEAMGVEAYFLDLSKYASYLCKAFILSDVTSLYQKRREAAETYARYLELLSKLPTNLAAFFPSYEFLNIVKERLKEVEKPLFYEEEDMPSIKHEALLAEFKSFGVRGGAIYLGVCGGRASEGVDFPEEELDIVFVAGVPFEEPNKIVEARLSYYIDKYGERGYDLAYVMPALRKVAQAIGRAFRKPQDKGVVILGDCRFKRLAKTLPRWLRPFKEVNWESRGLLLREIASYLGLSVEGLT
ncbi:MAG: ATP-dependent DNA helicase [Candidatus Nezhaarchaeota archaeon]|nr:ATP-dependent DNA helicase [Candidatus Nezhaarchaeota archaeon]